jgi:predicted DNA-binding transcriptional regulator AlpA
MDPLLDTKGVCQVTRMGRRTLWRRIATGEFPKPFKMGRKCVWRERAVDTYVKALEKAGQPKKAG